MNFLHMCLKDNESWMALGFLHCNESEIEVMVFGPSSAGVAPVDMDNLK